MTIKLSKALEIFVKKARDEFSEKDMGAKPFLPGHISGALADYVTPSSGKGENPAMQNAQAAMQSDYKRYLRAAEALKPFEGQELNDADYARYQKLETMLNKAYEKLMSNYGDYSIVVTVNPDHSVSSKIGTKLKELGITEGEVARRIKSSLDQYNWIIDNPVVWDAYGQDIISE